MVLALAVLAGLAAGFALGGRPSRIAATRLRATWLFYAAIAAQVAAYPSGVLPWSMPDPAATALWLGSYVLLVAAAALNLRVTGVPLIAVGMLSNLAAVSANGGHMPALGSALRAAGLRLAGVHNNSVAAAHPQLPWLVDRWAVPSFLPGGNVASVGDILIAAGAVVAAAALTGARRPWRRQPIRVAPT
ncbi:MAG TPA: DUF5317 family protein [Gaiellales bacterium]|nr:DUF5317 family protein [Gaiellales bacterium]